MKASLQSIVATATIGLALSAQAPAKAFLVTINGSNYDVTSQRISYNSHTDLMTGQPWWGDGNLAQLFASTVAYNLGTISAFGNTTGPIFAYGINNEAHPLLGKAHIYQWDSSTHSFLGETLDFAVATFIPPTPPAPSPVPLPAPILGSFVAFKMSRRLRTRLKTRPNP
jgi:hypothetical protein